MQPSLTIAKREFTSLFYSPIAYVVLGIFSLGVTLLFLMSFGPGYQASLRDTFMWLVWLLLPFLVPAISMRLISEEFRNGTIEPLMTAPLNDTQVVLGKWLGAMGFFVTLLVPILVLVGVLEIFGDPDYGPIYCGLLGLLLVGAYYLAIGIFASAVTQNQVIAFIVTVFIVGVLTWVMSLLPQQPSVPDALRPTMYHLDVNRQFGDFAKGLIDLSNVVYFLSGTAFFLFLAVLLLQSRRWR